MEQDPPARGRTRNRTDTAGQHVQLDERHAAEQNAIGEGKRFAPGDYVVEIVRCYAVDGDPEIWLPETDVTYFVAECSAQEDGSDPAWTGVASWVNRLRFNGAAQLKAFLIEAMSLTPARSREIDAVFCEYVVGPKNPLAGVCLQLHVSEPKGGPGGYQHHSWRRL